MATTDKSHQLMSWLLKPENLERLKNNKGVVRQLTKLKILPSSIRLYLRNLAGVTDKITEDFFSKSELKEIKRRVSMADAEGSMGNQRTSGFEQWRGSTDPKRGLIGYDFSEGFSLKGVLTNPKVNIDMTLGQAVFTKDKKGNIIIKDKHDFHGEGSVGTSYDQGPYEEQVGFPGRKTEFRPDPYSAETGKGEVSTWGLLMGEGRSGSHVDETDKEMRARADKALKEGDITTAGYARIIAQIDQQKEGIPIELNIGKITQEDKYKANPAFAHYIAQDTKNSYGKEYEDVGIPSAIRMEAQKYIKKRAIDDLDPNWQNVRMKDNWYWDKDLEMYRHMYDKPDLEEGAPFLFWDEGKATREYQDQEKRHHPTDTKLVPYFETESGEDLYPGFKRRDYEYKDGGIVSLIQNYK